MSTITDKQSPYVQIGQTRYCKYCGKIIDKYHHYCDCPDSLKLQEINHKVMELEIERIKLINSAPKQKFTTTINLTPVSYDSSNTVYVSDDEPPVNV